MTISELENTPDRPNPPRVRIPFAAGMSVNPNEFAKDPEAAQVLRPSVAGLWRNARNAAKELWKLDRGRPQVLLIGTNVDQARKCLAGAGQRGGINGGLSGGIFSSGGLSEDLSTSQNLLSRRNTIRSSISPDWAC